MPIHTNLTPERRQSMVELGAWNDKIITDYLDEAVASAGDKTAIITYRMADGSCVKLSYRELNKKVTRIAVGLVELGVKKGDIVSSSCWAWPRSRCWLFHRPSASSTTVPWPMSSSARYRSWRMFW